MSLGLGLIAAQSYFKEDDARKEREYTQALRDAGLSMLGDKTEAERTGYQLRTAQNRSEVEVLPQKTSNARERLTIEAGELRGQAERQPTELEAKNINAGLGLATAKNDQKNLPTALQAKRDRIAAEGVTASATLKQLPMKLEQLAVQGVLDQQGQSDVVLGTMGQLIARQDKAGALEFANNVAKAGNLLPNSNGKTFTDIVPMRKGQNGAPTDGYLFVTSDGKNAFLPRQAFDSAMGKLSAGEYAHVVSSDGSIGMYDKKKGPATFKQVKGADPMRGQGQTPADIQTMEYLVRNKVAGNPQQAWEMVRSAREKTRSSFIMDFVSKNAGLGADASKLSEEAGRLYDGLRQGQGQQTGPSNSPGQGRLGSGSYDPQINSLLGIPSQ